MNGLAIRSPMPKGSDTYISHADVRAHALAGAVGCCIVVTHPGKKVSEVMEWRELWAGAHGMQAAAHGQVPGGAHAVHGLSIAGLQMPRNGH